MSPNRSWEEAFGFSVSFSRYVIGCKFDSKTLKPQLIINLNVERFVIG